ncbi:hypothetical protein ACOSQ4_017934 [Xanthoceras sorbifolium]
MKELLQQHLYEKLSHSFSSHVCLYSRSLSVFPLTEPHTWAPHRGHPPDLLKPHLGSSSGSSPRISRNRIPGLLIGVTPRISRNRTWAPHRGHRPRSPGTAPGLLIGVIAPDPPGPPARIHLGLLPGS